MKLYLITIILFVSVLVAGCSETMKQTQDRHLINSELINSYNNVAIHNAIISQHTLFPYHFIKNSSELNELGDSDLSVLTKHFMKHPGRLNIRRDGISEELYLDRIHLVFAKLKEAGIDGEQIHISDGMPGGSGMPAERLLIILENGKIASAKTSTQY